MVSWRWESGWRSAGSLLFRPLPPHLYFSQPAPSLAFPQRTPRLFLFWLKLLSLLLIFSQSRVALRLGSLLRFSWSFHFNLPVKVDGIQAYYRMMLKPKCGRLLSAGGEGKQAFMTRLLPFSFI